MEPSSPNTIFNVKALHEALKALDITNVVQRTMALADDESPAYAWLDSAGRFQLAESAREIDGLLLFQVSEYDPEFGHVNYHIAPWLKEIGLLDFHDKLRSILNQEITSGESALESES
jgi:hypothetical protein